ncbi:LIM_bind domain-containing protein [Cephalotus follicularis]|uniref:LIM_bind domain-containing protein n=1 Tax=Cephalotus follicularis TaxID=3775 RepID=A0A1Q3D7Q4_CEPFO|nr:LIM_bind domain-containing protein [Cephalotus follicularis]
MVLSGPLTPIGGVHSASPSSLLSNSAILGAQGGSMPLQTSFSSLVSPRAQYDMNFLGNTPNISSLLNQTFENGGSNAGLTCMGGFQRGTIDNQADFDPLTTIRKDIAFSDPSSFVQASLANSGSSAQVQNQQISNTSGNPMLSDKRYSQVQQYEQQKFLHGQQLMQQFPISPSQPQQHQMQQQQQQIQSIRGTVGSVGSVKFEPQTMNDQIGPQQQLQFLQNIGPVMLKPQQHQMGRGTGPVELERQHSDQTLLLQQQRQQQHQFLHLSRQSSQAAVAQMNFLQHQRILQLQQQQQQQMLQVLPQQRPQLQQQFQQQNKPARSATRPIYEPGTCARRLTQYMYQQQHRPENNNIDFWRRFVAEFFAPNAKKRWCVSLYGNSRQTNGVFPQHLQDLWHCQICNHKPGRGFETTAEVLPRLFKIKYDSGTLEELLYVDMPREYQNASGQVILDYAKVIQESVFEQLRVVRDGQLRIVFSPDLKIFSWEFCARCHEELIPRRLIIPQVSQLGVVAQKYQASAQSASSTPTPDLRSNCNMLVASARQLAKALEVPLVNDLGYTKRYVRCLQISEVVNSMKDLIDHSQETGNGPIECLAKFPRRTKPLSGPLNSFQLPDEHQQITRQNLNDDHHPAHARVLLPSISNGVASLNISHGTMATTTSTTTVLGLLRQNSMNSQVENQNSHPNSPYAGTPVQIPSAGSSTSLPAQPNSSSPFSSPTPSSSNNPPQSSVNALGSSAVTNYISSANSSAHLPLKQSSQLNETAPSESQSSVDKIFQEIMNSSEFGGGGSVVRAGSIGNSVKNINELPQVNSNSLNGGSYLVGDNMISNNSNSEGGGFGNFGGGNDLTANASGISTGMGNNSGSLAGRIVMPLMSQDASMSHQQNELAIRLLNGLGVANGYNNLLFDWKSL